MLRQSLRERPDDVTLTSLLLKCLQSPSLPFPDALGLCLFALTLLGDLPSPQLILTLRDGLLHRIRAILSSHAQSPLEDVVSALRPLPVDLITALWQAGRAQGGQQRAALEVELSDVVEAVVEEDFLRRFEEAAIARR